MLQLWHKFIISHLLLPQMAISFFKASFICHSGRHKLSAKALREHTSCILMQLKWKICVSDDPIVSEIFRNKGHPFFRVIQNHVWPFKIAVDISWLSDSGLFVCETLSGANIRVTGEFVTSAEGSLARFALEGSFSRVNFRVSQQVADVRELFPTDCARVGSLARMTAPVLVEVARVPKHLVAILAGQLLDCRRAATAAAGARVQPRLVLHGVRQHTEIPRSTASQETVSHALILF